MSMRMGLCLAAVLGAGLFISRQAVSQQDGQEGKAPGPEPMQAMMEGMKKWLATIEPGENHKHLAQFVGTWNTTTKMWWGGPRSPAVETKGTSEVEWVLGKRYVMETHKGETVMPDMTGSMKTVPYDGIGLTGYDNNKNIYVGTWVSSLSTELLTMTGTRDPSGKRFTSYGKMDEPMLDMVGRMVKYVTRIVSADTHVFEIYDLAAGDDYKVIEITYERKK